MPTKPLNIETFAHGWKLLNKRFKNECDSEIMMIYFEELQSKLSAEEYAIAVKRCILEEQFFPSAKIILNQVIEDAETKALSEWDKILKLCPDYSIAQITASRFNPPLNKETQQALSEIGGWKILNVASEKDFPFLRRDFVKCYQSNSQSQARQNALSGTQQKAIGGQS